MLCFNWGELLPGLATHSRLPVILPHEGFACSDDVGSLVSAFGSGHASNSATTTSSSRAQSASTETKRGAFCSSRRDSNAEGAREPVCGRAPRPASRDLTWHLACIILAHGADPRLGSGCV
jgi:hypothetical protein